jgi:hypothetical protein
MPHVYVLVTGLMLRKLDQQNHQEEELYIGQESWPMMIMAVKTCILMLRDGCASIKVEASLERCDHQNIKGEDSKPVVGFLKTQGYSPAHFFAP